MQITTERDVTIRRWSDFGQFDWYVLGPVLILICFGFLLLKSTTGGSYLPKQLIFLIPAFAFGTIALMIRLRFWQDSAIWIYFLNILFLIFVLIKGTTVLGAQRWIDIGPVNLQPSEIAKIAIIISLAAWFAKRKIHTYLDIVLSTLIVIPPILLILKQPDLGTSLSFVAIYLAMTFWAGASVTHLLVVISPLLSLLTNATGGILFSIGSINLNNQMIELGVTTYFLIYLGFLLAWLILNYKPWQSPWIVLFISSIVLVNFVFGFARPILWGMLKPYQQQRLIVFLNPESDPQGAGYHIVQSLLAIGNGGFFGYGWLNGRLTKGSYVPAQHTDFVFSVVGEEFGFIGASIVVGLFFVLLWRILYVAKNSSNRFASMLAIGIFALFTFHIFINIGMTLGLMPITGVPLPFLSYGGSSMVTNIFAMFLILSISWRVLPRKMF